MTHRVRTLTAFAALTLAAAAGCGGSRNESPTDKLVADVKDNVDLYADLTGISGTTPVEVNEEKPVEQPAAASDESPPEPGMVSDAIDGPQGAFYATMKIAGADFSGSYSVLTATANPEVVMKGVRTGTEIRLNPGKYDMVFMAGKVAGDPEFPLRDVEIKAGRRIKREVKIPTGQITLVTGDKCVRKPIKIKQKGSTDWYKGKFTTCEDITLLAGEYEAELQGNKKEGNTPITGIQVYDGGKRDILIRHQ